MVNGALKNLDVVGNVSGALLKIQGGTHGDCSMRTSAGTSSAVGA